MSRVQVWKQEAPTRKTRLVLLPTEMQDGPCDDILEIVGVPTVHADENNDFIVDPKYDPDGFDAVHTFATVRQIINFYHRALRRLGRDKSFHWQWGSTGRLQINPRAGKDPSASYSRKNRSIAFFSFKRKGKMKHTARSFDIVAHEVGHAILDAIRPGYWSSWQLETCAIHESFADLTVILTTIAQPDLCKKILFFSKGNLHDKSFFSSVNGDFGASLGKPTKGFAAASNQMTMHDAGADIYSISCVFTATLYDIVADFFKAQRKPDSIDDALTLLKTGEHITDLLLKAMLRGPARNAVFKDIADKMISLEKNKELRNILKQNFEKRFILGINRIVPPTKPTDDIRWGRCQCCLTNTEHLVAMEDGIVQGQSCLPIGRKILGLRPDNALVDL